MSSHSLPVTWRKSRQLASRPPTCEFVRVPRVMSSCFPDVAPVSDLCPLCRCWISAPSVVFSRTFVLQGLLVQHSNWSAFSVETSRPSVLYDSVPYAVQERHGGSSVCGRGPSSSGTHDRLESVSSAVGGALRLCRSPYRSSRVPTVSTSSSSLGTSGCVATFAISTGVGSVPSI
jgi:hypothetical protein